MDINYYCITFLCYFANNGRYTWYPYFYYCVTLLKQESLELFINKNIERLGIDGVLEEVCDVHYPNVSGKYCPRIICPELDSLYFDEYIDKVKRELLVFKLAGL